MLEGLVIALWVIWCVLFPASEKDANPFEGERTDSGMMALALGALAAVVSLGPRTVAD